MIRIVENNDWIIYSLLGVGFLYVVMFRVLLRDISLIKFFTLKEEFANNTIQSWVITSVGFTILASVALSDILPINPHLFAKYFNIFGYTPNKVGSIVLALVFLFFFRTVSTYFFLASIGEVERWKSFYFLTTKFFLGYSLALIGLVFVQNYLLTEKAWVIYMYIVFFCMSFIFKNLVYLFHHKAILPDEWYYKILYICTLQILPFLVVWKFLFF
ncbi:DUF4271 domain-containing protein [Riemerella anatipestifer]|uniref:DUF4271 domain-containing protein n=1 Tax=Riemerella anatipestifer TaxID=34085 RepID=UPI00069BD491|nr:DUF4271 domain-containing protein [Riemerella anatipestifer]MBO4233421.1 DUF4271 domain-containing protein [Riemerella anatipestifer]MCO4304315.1 DUF4271 domain-containing protein [Riemerella anatipestifer]MCO7353577.1 DUF4271 domain-containing protein [Riemerella anatipestifer]MCQ4039652.1 DUF4271 domain-containing protein [Riemerella anatipestifer]MCT6761337.1 DUF4271 domain-containing protein [Riemerella anatipestifer]